MRASGRLGFSAKCFGAFAFLIALIVTAVPLLSQIPTGTILGIVKDSSGAAVAGAAVSVTNVETNQARTGTTESDGSYRFPALPVGRYTVKIEMTGFRSESRENVLLNVAQEQTINATLQVGATQQEVVVTGEAPLVNITTSSLGGLVNDEQIADLPLNGRNYVDLTLMQTGISQHTNYTAINGLVGTFFSSNGAPVRSNTYMLDGANLGNLVGASTSSISGTTLGVDGIREYKVVTNSFSAEYGLSMGSQMTIVTKSGSNRFSGDVFEYLRNSALDARNTFDYLYTLPTTVPGGGARLAPFVRNQFGGSLGGPIKKDKTFFFATYEGLRAVQHNPSSLGVAVVPPAACHTANYVVSNTACLGLTKPGTTTVAPVMRPLLDILPSPNLPGNEFDYLSTQADTENYGQMRMDQTFSAADTFFARYTIDDGVSTRPEVYPQIWNDWRSRNQFVTLSETHVVSPTLLNTARFSFSRTNLYENSITSLSGPQYSCVAGNTICNWKIGGLTPLGVDATTPLNDVQNIFSLGDDVFWTKGKHALKLGVLLNQFQQFADSPTQNKGMLQFTNLQSFLLGTPATVVVPTPGSNPRKFMVFDTYGFYLQDDYRVLPRLTLNLGLRYEFNTTPRERDGRESNILNPMVNPTPTLGPLVGDPSYHNFSPRVGFAWDVTGSGKTSVKGGFALLYDISNLGSLWVSAGASTPPFANRVSYVNPGLMTMPLTIPCTPSPCSPATQNLQGTNVNLLNYSYKEPRMLDYNLSVERQLPSNMVLSVAYAGSRGLHLFQPTELNPRTPTIVNGAYTWPSATAPLINPYWGSVSIIDSVGVSRYNALQTNLTKRVSHGLQFQVGYTYSRVMDDDQGILGPDTTKAIGPTQVTNPFNPMADYGPAAFDRTHNLHVNSIYHLPDVKTSRVVGKLLQGWWTGNIVTFESGYPFNPLIQSQRSQSGVGANAQNLDRPNSILTDADLAYAKANGEPNAVLYNPDTVITGNPNQWFNPNMFMLQPRGSLGDIPRNSLRGPGLVNWDFSVNKDTSLPFLGEAGKLQFRAELFNVLNKVNYGMPSPTVFTGKPADLAEAPLSNAGLITNTATDPRQIQFSLKILF